MTWYVVDGMDGSGKSTAAEYMTGELTRRGRRVLLINHPNKGTRSGRLSDRFLHMRGRPATAFAAFFFLLDVLGSLRRMRREGPEYDDIVMVRYLLSVAYLPDLLYSRFYKLAEKLLPVPDASIYVDVPGGLAMDRIEERGDELEIFETAEKLERTRGKMRSLTGGWMVLDNSGSEEETRSQLDRMMAGGR
jgi:dTMP kinase